MYGVIGGSIYAWKIREAYVHVMYVHAERTVQVETRVNKSSSLTFDACFTIKIFDITNICILQLIILTQSPIFGKPDCLLNP